MGVNLSCVPQSLWVERTSLFLVQSLPGISRWFEVDKREVVRTRLVQGTHFSLLLTWDPARLRCSCL